MFDNDPAYQRLAALRDSGYDGPVDEHAEPTDRHAETLDALRRRGASAR